MREFQITICATWTITDQPGDLADWEEEYGKINLDNLTEVREILMQDFNHARWVEDIDWKYSEVKVTESRSDDSPSPN